MKKALRILSIVAAFLAAALLAVWFLPLRAGEWGKQEPSVGYTGAFVQNDALDALTYLDLGGYAHPETVLVREGWVYLSVRGGTLLRMREDGSDLSVLLETGGCLLGFDFDREGNLIVVDCDYRGTGALLRVAGAGEPEVLLSKDKGCELFYPNAVAIAADGTIYLTDSSRAFAPRDYDDNSSLAAANEALMHTCSGRILAYDPQTGAARTLAEGLAFSNGLALSADEKRLFVCETYAYAVVEYDLETGTVKPFLDNLPGFPDNLTRGLDGRYWVGLNGARSQSLDEISDRPLLRKIAWLIGKLSPAAENDDVGYCHVFAFTEDGAVTESLQSGQNGYYRSTGATETAERLYIQSINNRGRLGYIERGA